MGSLLGQTISHYRILAPLGSQEGVYVGKDAQSGRPVCIRFFPKEWSGPDSLGKLRQLTRSVTGLNYRHILAASDFGESGERLYSVTELPEAETLRERIAARAVRFTDLLDLGAQIASALDAAHSEGIVHGALQPVDIWVTRQSEACVIEFGLYELLPLASRVGWGADGYLSPEQVRGKAADARSDLFALGAILYEMATGHPAFQGPDAAGIHQVILESDPAPPSAGDSTLPAMFDSIIARALAKNPDERYQTAADIEMDLRRLLRDWESERVAATRAALAEPGSALSREAEAPKRAKGRRTMTIAAALLLAAAGGAIAVRMMRRPATALPAVYHRLTFRRGTIETARFAPDGRTIFYSAAWDGQPPQIFSVQPQSPESRPLGLNDAAILSVSPAGELAILTGLHDSSLGEREGTLATLTAAGGVPQTILQNAEDADWSPIGKGIVVVRRVNGEDRLEYPIGTVLAETRGAIGNVRFSPDGTRIAFVERPEPGSDGGTLDVVDVNGGRETLSRNWASLEGLAWSPGGKQIWFTAARHAGQQVYVVTLSGQLRQVAAMAGSLRLEDIAADGRMLLVRDDSRRGMIEMERGQKNEQNISWLDGSQLRDLAADGKTVLFDEAGEAGGVEQAIYLRRIGSGDPTRLAAGRALALSPDGKSVLAETPEPDRNLILLPTAGGEAVNLPKVAVSHQWAAWLPDGKRFVFLGREPGHGLRLFVQNVAGGLPRAFSPAGVGGSAALSPDGSRVATMGPDGKGYLYPVDGGAVPTFRGLTPADRILGWSRYGAELYVAEGTLPVTVFRMSLASGRKTQLWQLAPADAAGVTHLGEIRVTPDGSFCAYSYRRTFSYLYLAEGLE